MTKAKDLDNRFNQRLQELTIDVPNWLIHALDREAHKRGLSREAMIQAWLSERIEQVNQNR